MNKFLKPTFFKIIITVVILLIAFGGNILYSRSIIFTENGFEEPNLVIRTINYISGIILYPASSIAVIIIRLLSVNPINFNPYGATENFISLFFIFLPFVIIEGYLISCIISIFINKTVKIWRDRV